MKRPSHSRAIVVLVIVLALLAGCEKPEQTFENPVDGWAVLAEKDDYTGLYMDDLPVDYIGITRMRQTLEDAGWNPDHIRDLREFSRKTLQAELDWLKENADENDIVILYVTAHGDYLSDVVLWHEFFADEWERIVSQRRLLVVDACFAADFTNTVVSDQSPHMSVAAVDGDEYGWIGIEEEGLPIIGGVFTYYFTEAFDNPASDTNGDGMVSVQEAAKMAEGQQRAYLHEVVLAVPEFVEMFHDLASYPEGDPTYPHVKVDDTIGEPLLLALDAYP